MRLFQRAAARAAPSPASTPNSASPSVSGVIVAALMTTNGPDARSEAA
jgi:hypothetical protein